VQYLPFGLCRFSQGTLGTTKLFTGQRLDSTGLYYYDARYYDATIGRFISPDTEGVDYTNPQSLNRYTYCLNNPLNRNDPTGNWSWKTFLKVATIVVAVIAVVAVAIVAPALVAALAPALAAPITAAITGVATGASAYTATIIVTNTIKEQAPLAGWNAVDCATAAAGNAILGYGTSIISSALTSAATSTATSAPPDKLYHYTNVGNIIRTQGLNPYSGVTWATNSVNLDFQTAQTGLNMNKLPTGVVSIDVYKALQSGATLSGPSQVLGPNGLPTGLLEWTFDGYIPPWAIK